MKLTSPGKATEERTTYTDETEQTWRQVGWMGLATDEVYALDDAAGCKSDPAGIRALWVLAFEEPHELPEPEGFYKGQPIFGCGGGS